MRPPVGREHRRVDDHVAERDVAHQLEAGHDHSVLPEEDDLAPGRVDVARDRSARSSGVSSGQPSVANGQSADENHVSSTSGSRSSSPRAALRARVRLRLGARHVAVGAVPDRQLVPPPELARDVPRPDRLRASRARRGCCTGGWNVTRPDSSAVDRGMRELGPSSHPPLERHERLDARAASARSGRPRAGSSPASRAGRAPAATRRTLLGRLVLGQPDELGRDVARHAPVEADHGQLGEAVVAADLEVDRVVPGRDLQRAGAERRARRARRRSRARAVRRRARSPPCRSSDA